MSCIVKQKRKGTDNVYAYESESIWIPGVGPRSKRRLLGRIDPETGAIVPTRKKGQTKKKDPAPSETGSDAAVSPTTSNDDGTRQALIDACSRIQLLEASNTELKKENRILRTELESFRTQLQRMEQSLLKAQSTMANTLDTCISVCRQKGGTQDKGC